MSQSVFTSVTVTPAAQVFQLQFGRLSLKLDKDKVSHSDCKLNMFQSSPPPAAPNIALKFVIEPLTISHMNHEHNCTKILLTQHSNGRKKREQLLSRIFIRKSVAPLPRIMSTASLGLCAELYVVHSLLQLFLMKIWLKSCCVPAVTVVAVSTTDDKEYVF
ncbi:hypothetical protein WMY93_033571 [Mugilogobius chulae]|uniref:Uncharacterized protein n=1 Tax=Mugilogobius chulae TaxID=88201 RepID=A0AAW0MKA3_9GOBI